MNPRSTEAGRVWQRVLAQEPREQQTLQMLMRLLSLDIDYLKQLARSGEDPTIAALIQSYTGQLHSLRGILLLTGGTIPPEAHVTADHSLHLCFDHALRRLSAYQLRSSDPIYGPAFREMAGLEEQHCFRITQLLGMKLRGGKEKGR